MFKGCVHHRCKMYGRGSVLRSVWPVDAALYICILLTARSHSSVKHVVRSCKRLKGNTKRKAEYKKRIRIKELQ